MKQQSYSTHEVTGRAVHEVSAKKTRRIGKIHSAIFHPQERRVIGFTIKRPDVALMFHRSERAMPVDAFSIDEDGHVLVSQENLITGKALAKRFGVSWDECLIWQGMSLMTEEGQQVGYVGDIVFSVPDGRVESLVIDKGGTHNILIGKASISADEVKGFQLGVGGRLNSVDEADSLQGAIVVSNEVALMEPEGGLAEKAGSASAKAADVFGKQVEKAKPVVQEATHKAGEAVNKGAFKLGEALGQTRGMFSNFKEEYNKALRGGDDDE